MDVAEFVNSLPEEMFADSDPDWCPEHGWECPGDHEVY